MVEAPTLTIEAAPDDPPEVNLWRWVILQAMRDAEGKLSAVQPPYRERVKTEATRWIGSKDFVEVCHLAMLDPEAVFDGVQNYLQEKAHA